MRIGLRKSPHLELLAQSIADFGDHFTSTNDTGADFYLAWGWPQAQDILKECGPQVSERIICVDAHPFALRAGDASGARIFQLGNWGALARYPWGEEVWPEPVDYFDPNGPVLVLGQVYTAEQRRLGLVDTWHTGGYEAWLKREMAQPGRVYRKHPRIWAVENEGQKQRSLEDDLDGCSRVVSWNSSAGVHARMLGYPATAAEAHGWAHMSLERLAYLRQYPTEIRSGEAWAHYRRWLVSLQQMLTG